MDDVRFDALVRSLGRLGPRRGALKALAALATGGLTLGRTVRPVAAIRCRDVGDCPEPSCQFVQCKQN